MVMKTKDLKIYSTENTVLRSINLCKGMDGI